MLKLWQTAPATPSDQATPRARAVNPFDDPLLNTSLPPENSNTTLRSPAAASLSFHQHHLLHRQPPLTPSATPCPDQLNLVSSPGPSTINKTVHPTTQVSLHAPVFVMQPSSAIPSSSSSTIPPAFRSQASSTSIQTAPPAISSSRGQLHLKLISARSLNVTSPHSRPYVVVQYDNNEFVSREPIPETEREVRTAISKSNLWNSGALSGSTGPAVMSRNSSTTALSALGAISISGPKKTSKALNGNINSSPASSIGSTGSAPFRKEPGTVETSAYSATTSAAFSSLSSYNPVWKHQVSFDVTSESSIVTLNIYDRVSDESTSSSGFLGTVDIKPVIVHDHTVDEWYTLKPHEHEKVTGSIRIQSTYEQDKTRRSLVPRDFEFLKLIGKGTFGRVFQVRKKDTKRIYAMKVLSKREIVAKKEVAHTIGERKILQKSLDSPFLVGLKFSFQTDTDLYLVTDFKSGGELFWHLQKDTRFSEDRARFYIAELVLALEHLHKYDIVYRDLKPENILLDATGHIALCDFGLSKADLPSDQLTNTFCGTTEYLAPEVLLDDLGYSKLVDFWSLGVLLFEMCCGWSPFYAEETQQMYKNICFGKIKFPKNVINDDGKQFVKALLNRNPNHRLGAQRDAAELKEHPFFKTIDWNALALKQVTPPFIPDVESDESVANFDPEFTGMSMEQLDLLQEEEWDDEDPSEAWVESASLSNSAIHSPNGPLGTGQSSNTSATWASGSRSPIEIKSRRKKPPKDNPLSSSVQDNFKGFSYTGESLATNAFFAAMHPNHEDDDEPLDDEDLDQLESEILRQDEANLAKIDKGKRKPNGMDTD